MIKTVIAAFAGTLIATASPAAARADLPSSAAAASAAVTTAPEVAPVAKPAKPKRYCIQDTLTGSRLPQRTCQTRDQWLAQGFDPLKK